MRGTMNVRKTKEEKKKLEGTERMPKTQTIPRTQLASLNGAQRNGGDIGGKKNGNKKFVNLFGPDLRADGRPVFIENVDPEQARLDAQRSYSSDGANGSLIFTDGLKEVAKMPNYVDHRPTGEKAALTFFPSTTQLEDLPGYINEIEKVYPQTFSGICKIVPPTGFVARKGGYEDIANYTIRSPVREIFEELRGVFSRMTETYSEKTTVAAYATLSSSKKYARPQSVEEMSPVELEDYIYKNIKSEGAIYGADSPGSLFKNDNNFKLDNCGSLLDELDYKLEGINTPYLYYGMWNTLFAWHTEDVELYSINYHHFGAPKYWISISPEGAEKFERLVDQLYPDEKEKCHDYIRHKRCVVPLQVLKTHGIPYSTMIQRAGEFIVTFPRGYHMGFNTGFNCAEAVNLALDRWIDFGKGAWWCECGVLNSIALDMEAYYLPTYRPQEVGYWMATSDINRITRSTEYPEERRSNKKTKIEEAAEKQKQKHIRAKRGGKWRVGEPLLSTRTAPEFSKEQELNDGASQQDPHCLVCLNFIPSNHFSKKRKVYQTEIPKRSERIVTAAMIAKCQTPPSTNDQDDNVLLTCTSCMITVHQGCYGGAVEETERAKWLCYRCRDEKISAIPYRNCGLCEMRTGALLPHQYGSDSGGFIHVFCAILDRSTSFDRSIGPTMASTKPSPRYAVDPDQHPISSAYEQCGDKIVKNSWFRCHGCSLMGETLIVCKLCSEVAPFEERTMVHATCGKKANFLFEERDYPQGTVMICDRHNFNDEVNEPRRKGVAAPAPVDNVDNVDRIAVQDFSGTYSIIRATEVLECSCSTVCKNGRHMQGARLKIRSSSGEKNCYVRQFFAANQQ